MISKKILGLCLILSVFLIAGCKKDDYVEPDGVCPVVISTIPINGATDVPLNQIISVTFNEEMNPSTITQASKLVRTQVVISIITGSSCKKSDGKLKHSYQKGVRQQFG